MPGWDKDQRPGKMTEQKESERWENPKSQQKHFLHAKYLLSPLQILTLLILATIINLIVWMR